SLFDALGSTPPADSDLDQLVSWGVGLVRVWAHWNQPIYGPDGTITPGGRQRLLNLVARLGARRLVLDLVLLRPGQLPGQRFALFSSPAARLRAVREITSILRPYRLIFFDVFNEHDHPDGPISPAEGRMLRDAVKAIDPARIVAMSFTSADLLDTNSRVGVPGRRRLLDQIGPGPDGAGLDLLAPHLPRTHDWSSATGARVTALREALRALGRDVPVLLDEERRAEAGEPPLAAEDYLAAAAGARNAGAAGWILHTSAGFNLGKQRFVDALNVEERRALAGLSARLKQAPSY
ncbi:MAG: hypothetical protein IMZ67_03315, partial [Acidobacteria bacterium]|nr:hypothetical protein [Acidobacteriota bacterium]